MHLLLTGPPGIGKTTVVKEVVSLLRSTRPDVVISGFFTEEVRDVRSPQQRLGFDVVTVDGQRRAPLARILAANAPSRSRAMVGRYAVDVASFEATALPALARRPGPEPEVPPTVLVVDEIGKMELFSRPFEEAVRGAFDRGGGAVVILGTVPSKVRDHLPLVRHLIDRSDTQLVTVSRDNRDGLPEHVVQLIRKSLDREDRK